MRKTPTRKLRLVTETLRALNPARLRAVRGGTILVDPVDPVTAPPTDRDDGGAAAPTAYTCTCIG